MCKLISPAGDFSSAIYAFQAGADAVYLGLKNFSARKSAINFSFEQAQKLKKYALENKKNIYIAINTIIKDNELDELYNTLYLLNKIQVDAIIIQDMGVFEIIKTYFPNLNIHASTQMAVHNSSGVKFLKQLGFKQVVLARELTFEQIKKIRQDNPDIGLEVFVHGALCYSVSGLCLASEILLNRSGNRGECAQVCRNFYELNNKKGYYFSCNDLALEKNILKLKNIGIDGFKIEGRMKSPEYTFHTTKLYKTILTSPKSDISKLKDNIKLCFSRNQTIGYFENPHAENLIDNEFSTHHGLEIGTVINITKDSFILKTKHKLQLRDGLMFFVDNNKFNAYKFSIKKIIQKKDSVEIFCHKLPKKNQIIYQVSSHALDLPLINENKFIPYQAPLAIKIIAEKNLIKIEFNLDSEAHEFCADIHPQAAKKENIIKILENLFAQSNKNLIQVNKININDPDIFIQPSLLKKLKNDFYVYLNKIIEKNSKICRDVICLSSTTIEDHVPAKNDIPKNSISLPPIIFEEDTFFKNLEKQITQNKNQKFILGINNIHHVYFLKKLQKFENTCFFLDTFTYTDNKFAISFYKKQLDKILFISKNPNPPLFYSLGCFYKHNFGGKCPKNCKKDYKFELTNMDKKFTVVCKDCVTYLFLCLRRFS